MCLKLLLGSGEDPSNRPEVEVSDRQGDQDSCYWGNRLTSSLFLLKYPVTLNVLKYQTLFSFSSQIKYWLLELEFAKCFVRIANRSCLIWVYTHCYNSNLTDVSLVLKDSNMDSENLSSLIRLSVSDGQKTDRSKVVSFIGI